MGDDSAFLGAPCADAYVIAVANPAQREGLARLYDRSGLDAVSLIHPSAVIGFDVEIGRGAVVCAGAIITTNVRVGLHVHIDRLVNVGHDCVIENFVTAHPAAIISGGVIVSQRSLIGAAACILPNWEIANDVVVGAGAVVTRNVEASSTVVGVPARSVTRLTSG